MGDKKDGVWLDIGPERFREMRDSIPENELIEMFRRSYLAELEKRISDGDVPEGSDPEQDIEDVNRWADLSEREGSASDPDLRWVDTAFRMWKTGTMGGMVFNEEELDEMEKKADIEMERQARSEEYRIKEEKPSTGLAGLVMEALKAMVDEKDRYENYPFFRRVYTLAVVSENTASIFRAYKCIRGMDIRGVEDPDFRRDWEAAMADLRCGLDKAAKCIDAAREKLLEDMSFEEEDWFKEGLERDGSGKDE